MGNRPQRTLRGRLALGMLALGAAVVLLLPWIRHAVNHSEKLRDLGIVYPCKPAEVVPYSDACATIATPTDGGQLSCEHGNHTHPSGCSFDVNALIRCSIPTMTMHLSEGGACDKLRPQRPASMGALKCTPCEDPRDVRGDAGTNSGSPLATFFEGEWVATEGLPASPGVPPRTWRFAPSRACGCGSRDPLVLGEAERSRGVATAVGGIGRGIGKGVGLGGSGSASGQLAFNEAAAAASRGEDAAPLPPPPALSPDVLGHDLVAAFRSVGIDRVVVAGDSAERQLFNSLVSSLRLQPTALDPAAQVSAHYSLRRWGPGVAGDVAWWSSPANEEAGKFDASIYKWGLDTLIDKAARSRADPMVAFQADYLGTGTFRMQWEEVPRYFNQTSVALAGPWDGRRAPAGRGSPTRDGIEAGGPGARGPPATASRPGDAPRSPSSTLFLSAVCYWELGVNNTVLPDEYVRAIEGLVEQGYRVGLVTCATERVKTRPDQLKPIAARNDAIRRLVADVTAHGGPQAPAQERPPPAPGGSPGRLMLIDFDAMTRNVPAAVTPNSYDYHYACWLHSTNGWSRGPILWVGTHNSRSRYYDRLRGPNTGLCDDVVNHAAWQQIIRRVAGVVGDSRGGLPG